jgi:acyl-coenzyme A thioesterase PaaI-like protein
MAATGIGALRIRCELVSLAWGATLGAMQVLPHTRSCFVCGESNPFGLRLRFHTDGRIVRTEFVPRPEHIGFKHTVHGGIIATLLDEMMVWACAVQTKQFGYCAELTVRFQQPLRPGEEAIAAAELMSNRRNRLFEARADLRNGAGALLAAATGKYLPIKSTDVPELMSELIGNVGMFQSQ